MFTSPCTSSARSLLQPQPLVISHPGSHCCMRWQRQAQCTRSRRRTLPTMTVSWQKYVFVVSNSLTHVLIHSNSQQPATTTTATSSRTGISLPAAATARLSGAAAGNTWIPGIWVDDRDPAATSGRGGIRGWVSQLSNGCAGRFRHLLWTDDGDLLLPTGDPLLLGHEGEEM